MGIFFFLRIHSSVALAIINFLYFFSTYEVFWGPKYRTPCLLGSPPPVFPPKSKANLAHVLSWKASSSLKYFWFSENWFCHKMKPKVSKCLKPRNFGTEERKQPEQAYDVSKAEGSRDAQVVTACVPHALHLCSLTTVTSGALSSCVLLWHCTACFSRCSAPQHRAWKPSFASKAWRKQDSHLVALLESMSMCPLWCVGNLQGISGRMSWIQQKSIFHWNSVLPENFWSVLHWFLWNVENNSVNTRKSWSTFCVGSWLSS